MYRDACECMHTPRHCRDQQFLKPSAAFEHPAINEATWDNELGSAFIEVNHLVNYPGIIVIVRHVSDYGVCLAYLESGSDSAVNSAINIFYQDNILIDKPVFL